MKPVRPFTFHLVCLTVSLTFLANITQAEETLKTTEAQTQPSQGARVIHVANGLITVKVQDVSLRHLLQEIARQSDLTLVPSDSLEERITIEFHQLPLEDGLRRILRHRSFAVEYSRTPEESPSTVRRPKILWIFPKGKEDRATLGDDSKGGDSRHDGRTDIAKLEAALASADSWEREEAVEALGESGRPEAVAPLRLAMKDPDEDVREAAIAALTNIGGDAAVQALAIALQDRDASIRKEAIKALGEIGGDAAVQALAIALEDRDASIREEAVEALGEVEGESAIRLLEQALADEDESVRDSATELLEELRD